MGTVGDALDNALVESFFATLQVELIDRRRWNTRRELAQAIFEWIEAWYNPKRRHSGLDYHSPITYETRDTPAARLSSLSPRSWGRGEERSTWGAVDAKADGHARWYGGSFDVDVEGDALCAGDEESAVELGSPRSGPAFLKDHGRFTLRNSERTIRTG
jgi:putative transposase